MPLLLRTPLLLGLLAALVAGPAAGQTVTTVPAFPTVDQPLTVTVDVSGTPLAGYAGTVYAYTGVDTAAAQWQCVVGQWGENAAQLALTREGADRYSLQIDDVAAFYDLAGCEGVSAGDVTGLAFVFRSEDGGRQTADVHLAFSTGGLQVSFAEPAVGPLSPLVAPRDTTVSVVVAASGHDRLRLLVDGAEVASTAEGTLRYSLVLDTPGRRADVLAVAEGGAERDSARFYAVRNPDPVTAPRPAGLEDGITYAAGGTAVTLSLFAPYKDFAYVIGDATDWEVDPRYFMNREAGGADSTWFWLTVDGLTPGQEVGFQYLVDGEIRVADPYAEKVLTANDEFISDATYPGLTPYPEGRTVHPVAVLQPGGAAYDWQVEDFEAPEPHELVVYELLLRDFLAAHDYETLTDTLDYIERLGVNAVELMPVAEFDGNESWGYNPSFHLALDKYYGPAEDFKRFVDEAHRRGLAVILDVVYNHATGQSPLVRLWNEGDFGRPTAENPYANRYATHPFNVFNDLDHESAATQYWLDRANRYWLEEYRVDGFRFDLTKGFTQTNTCDAVGENCDVGAWSAYDASRVALLTRMVDRIWEVDADAIVIFEHLGVNEEEEVYAEYRTGEGLPGVLLWNNLNDNYAQAVLGYQDRSDFSRVHYSNWPDWDVAHNVAYMESHDEERITYKALQFGNGAGEYSVKDLGTALDRMAMAGAFFYTVPGPKMLWQFGEVGYDVSIDENDRTGNKPILWDEHWVQDDAEAQMRRDLYDAWADVIALRMAHDVFTDPETDVDLDVDGTVKRITLRHPSNGEAAVIVGNFGVVARPALYTFPATGTWYDFYAGTSFEVADAAQSATLAPGEFHVFTTMRPAGGGFGTSAGGGAGAPAFALGANRPNPFGPETAVDYSLDRPGPVRLDVFDTLGRRVATLVDGEAAAGPHTATFRPGSLASGVYVVRLEAGGQVATRRVLLVR